MKKISKIAVATLLLSSCATPGHNIGKWKVFNLTDEFTNVQTCRVEESSATEGKFLREISGKTFSYHFYTENRKGEVRAGIRAEPLIPINGNIQIKVGDKLFDLNLEDQPEETATLESSLKFGMGVSVANNLTQHINDMPSAYRAYKGDEAKNLLKEILNHEGYIKYRVKGAKNVTLESGKFKTDKNFKQALKRCNINL